MNHKAPDAAEAKLIGGAITEKKAEAIAASPVTHVSKNDPPFLIIHGDRDMVVPFNQSVKLAKMLKDAGVETALIEVKNGGHGGFQNPRLDQLIRQFFDRNLRDRSVAPVADATLPAKEVTKGSR